MSKVTESSRSTIFIFWIFSILYCKKITNKLNLYHSTGQDFAERMNCILQIWILIEGFTKEVVEKYLKQLKFANKEDYNNCLEDAEMVKVVDWTKVKNICKKYGLLLEDKIDSQLWQTIQKIYDFRNGIAHGNNLEIVFTQSSNYAKPQEIKRFQKAINHFSSKEINVMNEDILISNNSQDIIHEIFNAKFLKFIFNESIKYCLEIVKLVDYKFLERQLIELI